VMDAVRLCYIAFGLKNIGNTNFKIRARRFCKSFGTICKIVLHAGILQIVWNNLQNHSAERESANH